MRTPACSLALLLVCLGGARGEPPTVTDPSDRRVLDAFLAHAETAGARCTPERMARFASQPEDITWQGSRYIKMALAAYRLTGEAKYLDMFVQRMDTLCQCLKTGPDGFRGFYGLPLKLFRHPGHPNRQADVMLTSFVVAGLMADFARAAQANDALKAKYAKAAERYLDVAENHLVKKWDARGRYKDLGDDGAVYITHADLKPVKASLTQPHNKHSKIAKALISLHAATGNDAHLVKAIKLGTRFKRSLTRVGGHYKWNYWDPAGAWDIDPANRAKWKHWIGAEHRGGYYSLSLAQAVRLYELGLVFDRTDIDRFVKTQTTVCWNGSIEQPRWARTDGRRMTTPYLCSALAPFDERIFAMAFGGAAQRERLARRDHSWQGGVVACDWLALKYLTHPRWKAPKPAETDLVKPFLAKPANRALVERLKFAVRAQGYKAPATPAQMKPMQGAGREKRSKE